MSNNNFTDIFSFVQEGFYFIIVVESVKELLISRFNPTTTTPEGIKGAVKPILEFAVRKMVESEAQLC